MGVGNFFGMLPDTMQDSRLYGVELDSITGRIAKKLYPQADITVAGFETTDRRDFYDLAVGNVPFGQYKVNDKAYNKLGFSIHNYFFAKAIDQVRPGGVVAFVTSRYTMPELQIIPQEEFEAAQRIREDRSAHAAEEAEHHVPLRTRGQALLSNNVYCGHCGARLALTTSRKWRKLPDGTLDDTLRIRYTCYGKLRKQTDCTGQTGYTMHILDEIIDKMVRQIFSRLRGIPKEQLITSRYAKETAERKNHLQALQAERDKAEKDLLALKTEILAVIKGESAFPKDTLAEMIAAQEKKHTELEALYEEASAELERNAELMANVSQLYEELISYADLYDSASFEAKKMIVSQLIRRVDVYRGYQIHVDFNFDLAQYLENSDELAC